MGVAFAIILGILISPLTYLAVPGPNRPRVTSILLGSYVLRIFLFLFIARSVSFFSHGATAVDSLWYEYVGRSVANMWHTQGIYFMRDEALMPGISKVALPINLFAMVIYLTGDSGGIGITGLVAFLACAVCLVIFKFAIAIGSSEESAIKAMKWSIFGPSFLYYTSDTYKDGINALCVVAAVWLAVELGKRLSIANAAALLASLVAVYYVRPYMVFMCASPALMGFLGLRKGLTLRSIVMTLAATAGGLVMIAYFSVGTSIAEEAAMTFEHATSSAVTTGNASGGSGVLFNDGGNPFGAIHLKLLYTLCSPFPWMGGSLGLQLGKIESGMFYYYLYSAYKSSRILITRSTGTLVMIMSFLLPATVAYATTMANVGLIVRQRMPLVMVTCVLASVYWTEEEKKKAIRVKAPPKGVRRLGGRTVIDEAPPEPPMLPPVVTPPLLPTPGRSPRVYRGGSA